METITFLITVKVKAEVVDDQKLRETMALLATSVRNKPGARFYQSFRRNDDGKKLEFIEIFSDSSSALSHLKNQDPELAKTLLKEAGYEKGLTLSLKLPPPSYARRGGEIIASQLRAVGITTEISNLEWAQWLEQVFRGHDFDLTIVSHTEPMDINIYARPDYYFGYDNPDFQELMEQIDSEQDPDLRSQLFAEAQIILADDYVNGFLFQLARTGVAAKGVEGLWPNSPTQANDLTGVRWSE